MSTRMVVSINGVSVKQPTDFSIERYDLTKSGRVASGKMTMELVAKKRKFLFSYEVMSGTDLDKIRSAIDTEKMFFPLVYIENGVEYHVQVYRGALKYRRFRTDGVWYWKNVQFDLIEQ